jgi:hypothetical protein
MRCLTARDPGLSPSHSLLGVRVGQQLQGRLDARQLLGGDQDDVLATVLRDVHTLVRAVHLVGDVGQAGLGVRKRRVLAD